MHDVLPEDAAILGASEQAGAVERARAAQAYRRAVRTTGIAISFGVAAVFVVNTFLPGVTPDDRRGLLVTAALVAATGTIWFGVVPRHRFGAATCARSRSPGSHRGHRLNSITASASSRGRSSATLCPASSSRS